jgi:hypothetical protein
VGVPQDIAHLRRESCQSPRSYSMISDIGGGQFRGQRDLDRPNRHGQMPCPAVPPAVPPGLRPPRFGVKRRMGNLPLFLVRLVPNASARFQGCAVDRCSASVGGPGREQSHQRTPKAADQAGQMLGQGLQEEAVRICLGSSSWLLDWYRRPREVVNESNQADKEARLS